MAFLHHHVPEEVPVTVKTATQLISCQVRMHDEFAIVIEIDGGGTRLIPWTSVEWVQFAASDAE